MRRPSRPGLSLVLAFCAGIPLAAQNLESIGTEKPFSFSGGISFNQIFYSASGIALRRDPYSYVASGHVNLSVYGWTIPLKFSISNKGTSFSQPFNQYSIHPTWKWIMGHAGYTSMSFSPYTVNGHIFLGGALEMAPEGKWKISALHGRFLKAVEHDTSRAGGGVPAYQRNGYGLKATYGTGQNFIDLILFHAGDAVSSIQKVPDSLFLAPQENVVFSVGGGKSIAQYLLLKAELATSAITRDKRTEKTRHSHLLARAGLFGPRLSSAFYHAFKTSFNYQKEAWTMGLAYERVDPGYRTLGAYYFNNDLENLTVNASAAMSQRKLNVAISAGIQHDNLDKTKVSTMRRMVGSMNVNYTPSQKSNLSASYSSFQTYTNIRSRFETINQLTPFDNLDTLNFTQISRNASFSGVYGLPGRESKGQHITVQFTWQDAADTQGQVGQHSGTSFYNVSAGYSVNLVPRNMNMAVSFNTAINEGPFIRSRMIGPTASISRSFFQRTFRITFSSSYSHTYTNGVSINTALNNRFNAVFSLRRKHNLNVSATVVTRITKGEIRQTSFSEFTGTMGYSYVFGSSQ